MKKIVIFSVSIAAALWILVYINGVREKEMETPKVTVVESQGTLSSSKSSEESAQSSSSSNIEFKLRVLSDPEGAAVLLENESVGQTPVDITIPEESKKIKLSLTGYEDYERQIPAAKDAEGDLVWKIQLKKAVPEKPIEFYTKKIAPFSVQIKAINLSDLNAENSDFGSLNVKLCRVNINDQTWVRVVNGPYANKKKAQAALTTIKKDYPDAFLATEHKCLKDGDIK